MGKPDYKIPSTSKQPKTSDKKSVSGPVPERKKDAIKLQPLVATKVLALNTEDVVALSDVAYRCFMHALDEACMLWMKKDFQLTEDFIEEMETVIGVVQIAILMFRARINAQSTPEPRYTKEDWTRLAQPFSMKTFADAVRTEYCPVSPAAPPDVSAPKKKKSSSWADQVEEQEVESRVSRMEISTPHDHKRGVTPQAKSRRRIRADPSAASRVAEKRLLARRLAEKSEDLKGLISATVSSTQARTLVAECFVGFVPLVLVDQKTFDTIGENKFVAIDYEMHDWKRVLPPFIVTLDVSFYGKWDGTKLQAPSGIDLSGVTYATTYADLVALGAGAA